jgi:hypothetical protein
LVRTVLTEFIVSKGIYIVMMAIGHITAHIKCVSSRVSLPAAAVSPWCCATSVLQKSAVCAAGGVSCKQDGQPTVLYFALPRGNSLYIAPLALLSLTPGPVLTDAHVEPALYLRHCAAAGLELQDRQGE